MRFEKSINKRGLRDEFLKSLSSAEVVEWRVVYSGRPNNAVRCRASWNPGAKHGCKNAVGQVIIT